MAFCASASVALSPNAYAQAASYPVTPRAISVCAVDSIVFEETFDDRSNGGWRARPNLQNRENPPVGFSAATNNVANANGTQTDVTIDSTLNGGNGVASPSGGAFVSAIDAAGNSALWVRESNFGDLSAALDGAVYLEKWNWRRNAPAGSIADGGQDFIIFGRTNRLFFSAADQTDTLEAGGWEIIEGRLQPGPGWFVMEDGSSNLNRRARDGGPIRAATQADFDAILADVVGIASVVEAIGAFNFGDPTTAPTADVAERYALDTVRIVSCNASAISVDLSITKTNTPGVNGNADQASDTVTSGSTTTYTLTVNNNGPDNVTGAIVTDTPGSGITCAATNSVTITGNGVPAGSFTVADLTGAGITLDTLNNGQSATLTYSCEVN